MIPHERILALADAFDTLAQAATTMRDAVDAADDALYRIAKFELERDVNNAVFLSIHRSRNGVPARSAAKIAAELRRAAEQPATDSE